MAEHLLKSSKQKLSSLKRQCKCLDSINICRLNKMCTHWPPSHSPTPQRCGDLRNLKSYNEIKKLHFLAHLSVHHVSERSVLLHIIKIRS